MDDDEIKKTQEEWRKMEQQLADRFDGYEKSIPVNDEENASETAENEIAPREFFNEEDALENAENEMAENDSDREDDYRRRRLNRVIFPERIDPFLDKSPIPDGRTYSNVMNEEALKRQKEDLMKKIAKKKELEAEATEKEKEGEKPTQKRRNNRWDQSQDENSVTRNDTNIKN